MTVRFQGLKDKRQERVLSGFFRRALRALSLSGRRGEISVVFVSDRELARLHADFLGDPGRTDVITFPYGGACPPGDAPAFGDIYISLDTARRQAGERGHALVQELALLELHGLLHLLGYDDRAPRRRKEMFAAQAALFRKLDPALAPPDCGNLDKRARD